MSPREGRVPHLPTRSMVVVTMPGISTGRALNVPAPDIRGLGITVSRLDTDPSSHAAKSGAAMPVVRGAARPPSVFDPNDPSRCNWPPWVVPQGPPPPAPPQQQQQGESPGHRAHQMHLDEWTRQQKAGGQLPPPSPPQLLLHPQQHVPVGNAAAEDLPPVSQLDPAVLDALPLAVKKASAIPCPR